MNNTAKRNKYRGLSAFVAANFRPTMTIDQVVDALKAFPEWADAPRASVATAVYKLRNEAVPKTQSGATPNMLLVIPLPKRQSATLTMDEAKMLYEQLFLIFGH